LVALSEIRDWNFEAVKKAAENKWEKELQKIAIKSSDESSKKIFYSALYHTCVAPYFTQMLMGLTKTRWGKSKK
jgi:putative alpha-1,2-mannosidase